MTVIRSVFEGWAEIVPSGRGGRKTEPPPGGRELLTHRLLRESSEGGPFRVVVRLPTPSDKTSFEYRSPEIATRLEAEQWLMDLVCGWREEPYELNHLPAVSLRRLWQADELPAPEKAGEERKYPHQLPLVGV